MTFPIPHTLLTVDEVTRVQRWQHSSARGSLLGVGETLYFQVSSPELVREVLVIRQEEFSGRPVFFKYLAYVHFQEELICGSATATWKLKKKAVHTSLKMWVFSLSLQGSNKCPAGLIHVRSTIDTFSNIMFQKSIKEIAWHGMLEYMLWQTQSSISDRLSERWYVPNMLQHLVSISLQLNRQYRRELRGFVFLPVLGPTMLKPSQTSQTKTECLFCLISNISIQVWWRIAETRGCHPQLHPGHPDNNCCHQGAAIQPPWLHQGVGAAGVDCSGETLPQLLFCLILCPQTT